MTGSTNESSRADSFPESIDTQLETTRNQTQFVKLAQRISGLTSNLIATAIIVILALAGGRGIISWWRADPQQTVAQVESSPAESWILPADSHVLEFGDLPLALRREQVQADREEALNQLRLRCKESLESGATPRGEIGPAEERLLESTLKQKPVEQQVGKWRLFQATEPIPMVVGIRDDCPSIGSTETSSRSRMVVWGMTVPSSESSASANSVWTNYCCRFISDQDQTSSAKRDPIDVPLPSNARKTLAITDVNGGSVTGFAGTSPLETMEFYSQWAQQQNLKTVNPWRASASTWRRIRPSGA